MNQCYVGYVRGRKPKGNYCDAAAAAAAADGDDDAYNNNDEDDDV